jgi:hypothetical protein
MPIAAGTWIFLKSLPNPHPPTMIRITRILNLIPLLQKIEKAPPGKYPQRQKHFNSL